MRTMASRALGCGAVGGSQPGPADLAVRSAPHPEPLAGVKREQPRVDHVARQPQRPAVRVDDSPAAVVVGAADDGDGDGVSSLGRWGAHRTIVARACPPTH